LKKRKSDPLRVSYGVFPEWLGKKLLLYMKTGRASKVSRKIKKAESE